jgi:hypothetical protein
LTPKNPTQSRKGSKLATSRYEGSSDESNRDKASSSEEDGNKMKARKEQKMPAQKNLTKAGKRERDSDDSVEAKKNNAYQKFIEFLSDRFDSCSSWPNTSLMMTKIFSKTTFCRFESNSGKSAEQYSRNWQW